MLIQQDLFSYWDIILGILILFVFIPFIYIGYLKRLKLSEKNELYHFPGEYNANEIIDYIEKLEKLLGKDFQTLKTY